MPSGRKRIEIHVPTVTILKVLGTIVLVWGFLRLWPEILLLLVSTLLAVALAPVVRWMHDRGLSRGIAVMFLAVVLLGIVGLVSAFVMPPLAKQVVELSDNFPAFRARVERRLPADDAVLRRIVEQVFALPSSPEVAAVLNKPLFWGQAAVSSVMAVFLVLITTLYLLLDGRRLYAWILAYVPRRHREKMAETVPEVSRVVYAFVRGQLTISILFALYVAFVTRMLEIPAMLPLALLAAVCDVIPVIGIILATTPAALLALTVSPTAAAGVIVAFILYHLFETYFVVPRVYGSTLRVSTLGVLLAILVGGTLQGIIGAVLILPLVAAYPTIERIWLKNYLGPQVLADHRALAQAAETGNEHAIDIVLHGEEHPTDVAPRSADLGDTPGTQTPRL